MRLGEQCPYITPCKWCSKFDAPCDEVLKKMKEHRMKKKERKKMNDRYLYRAKRTDNGECVEGMPFEIEGKTMMLIQDDESLLRTHYLDENIWNAEIYCVEIDPSTICQCTAVPDRDNTIMFENDVVRASGGVRGVIRFGRYGDEKTDYGFYIEWEKSQPYWRNDIYYWQNELRVIGSYIDNPELLEVGVWRD